MWLFAAFLAVPLIEIALFITVGGWIGLWPTLLVVVLTAVVGTVMVRSQGAAVLSRLRGSLNELTDPTEPLAHGAIILFSGALLLTPGFFTDALGFLLLVPGVRDELIRQIRKRIRVERYATRPDGPRAESGDRVIEAEYEEIPPKRPTHRPPSGWTRH